MQNTMNLVIEALDETALLTFRRTIDTELDRRADRPAQESEVREDCGDQLERIFTCEVDSLSRLGKAVERITATGIEFPLRVENNLVLDNSGDSVCLIDAISRVLGSVESGYLDIVVARMFRLLLRDAFHPSDDFQTVASTSTVERPDEKA